MATTLEKPKRAERLREVYGYHISEIRVVEGFNVRQDFGDIEELAKSIKEIGIRVPLRGYKKDGFVYLTDGHRRFKALCLLAERGDEIRVPILPDEKGSNDEQRVIDMLVCNDGKRLNAVEQSEAVVRLFAYGYKDEEISNKTGFSRVFISNLKSVGNLPKKVKNMIISNNIKSTEALRIFREEKNFDKALELIESTLDRVQTESGKTKITTKDIQKTKGVTNSFSAIKKALKLAPKRVLKEDAKPFFDLLQKFNSGEYTFEQIVTELYEPEKEELPLS